MLRFIKHNLTSMDNIEIYPMISLLIFVLFFTVMLVFVFRMKKKDVAELSAMPFEKGIEHIINSRQ
jgi:cbb3-type cytochrome oxidase subunit 3